MSSRVAAKGQVLVMFVLFLLVLLGVSALAIDYAGWLLTDRNLQNASDHASLAGASTFDQRLTSGNCSGGAGQAKCIDARTLAWTSLNDELRLQLNATQIGNLAAANSVASGTTGAVSGGSATLADRYWVATPPPNYAAYADVGGRYTQNYGVVFVRIDRNVRSFLGGAIGINPGPRTGWSTAGSLPTDYALQVFCRNNIAPQNGVCVNSSALTIDGQGGIRLARGDIGSNESLNVSSSTGNGAVMEAGNVFLVNRTCGQGSWSCPGSNQDPYGGIVNRLPSLGGAIMKNAFYIAPLPVPQFQSPIDSTTVSSATCGGADATHLCVPYRDQSSSTPSAPGDWTCQTSGSTNRCGIRDPLSAPGTVSCVGQGGGNALVDYYPIAISSGASSMNADAAHPQSNANLYKNIDDDFVINDPDTRTPTPNAPVDYLYTNNLNITGNGTSTVTSSFTANLGQSGPRVSGQSTVTYVVFKTNNGTLDNSGYDVTVQVSLRGGVTAPVLDTTRTLSGTPTSYSFMINSAQITDYNSLQLQFTFSETNVNNDASERGGGVSWAEIKHPTAQPPAAPMIPPGYYRSIIVPDNSCMILDPTAEYSTLKAYQMPGIYRFGGSGSDSTKKIKLGTNSYLIGDGVTLVFDSDWPNSGSNQGVATSGDSALVLNTMRVPGVPPCTPTETETLTFNQSSPYLSNLPYSAVCAAWAVDVASSSTVRPGTNAWRYCDPASPDSGSHCKERTSYNPTASYRGITFYFTPDPGWSTAHASMNIRNRFEMQGTNAGFAFRGVMYAPYDDVRISGGNGFSTVGQVLAWSAKFNGGGAYIDLDYPYVFTPARPYLLEPTVNH